MIPVLELKTQYAAIQQEVEEAALRVLRSTRYILGPEVQAFEEEFAAWNGSAHAIGVGNGTDALQASLRALGIGPGDDQGRAVQAAKERAKAFLRQKQPFVWNATSLTGKRSGQVDLFESYHARVRIVYLETAWDESLRRNAGRTDRVPEHVIQRMLESLEPPETREAQAVDWICV